MVRFYVRGRIGIAALGDDFTIAFHGDPLAFEPQRPDQRCDIG
jgi:hypothetical protein